VQPYQLSGWQVHPKELTEALFKEAKQRGCELRTGRVEKIEIEDKEGVPTVVGVRVDGEVIPCDQVVIAMGPWSSSAAQGLQLPPIFGQKYHSVLVQNKRELSQSVFFQGLGDPEVYPRPKGEVYVTGFPDAPVQVQEAPGDEEVRQEIVDRLLSAMKAVSTEVGEAPVTKTQACHLPVSVDGDPIIGQHPKVKGAFIATGHGCVVCACVCVCLCVLVCVRACVCVCARARACVCFSLFFCARVDGCVCYRE